MTPDRRALWFGMALLACASPFLLPKEAQQADSGEQAEASALVSTAKLRRGPMSTTVSGYGTIVAVPGKTRNLTLAQGGLVSDVRVSAGERVKHGATLLIVISDPAARLAYEQAETGLALARTELERTRQLRTQKLATQSQVAAAEKALRDAGNALEAQREIGGADARNELKAPFDCVVLEVPVAPGDRTAAGATLVRTIAAGSVQIIAGLSPPDARRVQPGMPGVVDPAADHTSIDARVTHVQAMVDPISRLVNVVLEPSGDATSAALLTSEGARAAITVDTGTFWIAPRAAVLRDQAGAYLFQIVDGHAKRVRVATPGPETEQEIAVDGPFDPDAKLTVLGAYELEDGMAVRESQDASSAETRGP
jgi:RND family efflux transporter MFP subunit